MFETKLKPIAVNTVTRKEVNQFLINAKAEGNKTRSGNGALKFSTF